MPMGFIGCSPSAWRACPDRGAKRACAQPGFSRQYGPVTLPWRNTMIIEMRTYRLKPGSVADAEKRFAEGLKERVRVSPLGAFFHTEVGPLNRIIHCWPYEDL